MFTQLPTNMKQVIITKKRTSGHLKSRILYFTMWNYDSLKYTEREI